MQCIDVILSIAFSVDQLLHKCNRILQSFHSDRETTSFDYLPINRNRHLTSSPLAYLVSYSFIRLPLRRVSFCLVYSVGIRGRYAVYC